MKYRIIAVPARFWPDWTPAIREFTAAADPVAIQLVENLDSTNLWMHPLRFVTPDGDTCQAMPRKLTEIAVNTGQDIRTVKEW